MITLSVNQSNRVGVTIKDYAPTNYKAYLYMYLPGKTVEIITEDPAHFFEFRRTMKSKGIEFSTHTLPLKDRDATPYKVKSVFDKLKDFLNK